MQAREHLREWCADSWPEDDFTPEQNREDLAGHIEDAGSGFAYGYTVFDLTHNQVLGSVYLYPAAWFAARYRLPQDQERALAAAEVLVDYWLLPEIERSSAHKEFIAGLQSWLHSTWGFRAAAWATRPAMNQRRRAYESAGFRFLSAAESRHTPGWIQHYHLSGNG